MHYCEMIRFDQKPDYVYLRSLLSNTLLQLGLIDDSPFDWVTQKKLIIEKKLQKEAENLQLRTLATTNLSNRDKHKLAKITRQQTIMLNEIEEQKKAVKKQMRGLTLKGTINNKKMQLQEVRAEIYARNATLI